MMTSEQVAELTNAISNLSNAVRSLRVAIKDKPMENPHETEVTSPPMSPTSMQTSRELCDAAAECMSSGELGRALQLSDKAVVGSPHSARCLRTRGLVKESLKDLVGARADLVAAQTVDYDPAFDAILERVVQACGKATADKNAACIDEEDSDEEAPRNHDDSSNSLPNMGMPDLGNLMADPTVMQGINAMLQDPQAMSAIQDSELFRTLLSGKGNLPNL